MRVRESALSRSHQAGEGGGGGKLHTAGVSKEVDVCLFLCLKTLIWPIYQV